MKDGKRPHTDTPRDHTPVVRQKFDARQAEGCELFRGQASSEIIAEPAILGPCLAVTNVEAEDRVERYFCDVGTMSRLVQMNALYVARGDCECSRPRPVEGDVSHRALPLAPDPVAAKLVDSLARPGGNATGLTILPVELSSKRLQLLKELLPSLSRVGLLINPNEQPSLGYISEGEAAAAKLGLTQQTFEARTFDEIEPSFDAMAKENVQAVVLGAGGLLYQARLRIPELAIARRLPVCAWSKETFEPGALMSYGDDQLSIMRRTAVYVDRILKGARPSELPVEQPTRLQFLLNLKVAKALGLTIPPTPLALADEVIE